MKHKFQRLKNWYESLNKKQRIIIWVLSAPYAAFPLTGILGGGIPWAVILIYMEFYRNADKKY